MNRYFVKYRYEGQVFTTYVIAPDEECAKDCILGEVLNCYAVEFDVAC